MSDQPENSASPETAAPAAATPPPAAPLPVETNVADGSGAIAQPQQGSGGVSIAINPAQIISLAGAALVVVGLLVGTPKLWDRMSWMWAVTGIAAAVLTATPLIGAAVKLSAEQIRSVTLGAAIALGAWWALFILPLLETTGGFLVTAGAAVAIISAVKNSGGAPAAGADA